MPVAALGLHCRRQLGPGTPGTFPAAAAFSRLTKLMANWKVLTPLPRQHLVLPLWVFGGRSSQRPAANEVLKLEHKEAIHCRSCMENASACPELLCFFSAQGFFSGTPEAKLPARYKLKRIQLQPVYSSSGVPRFPHPASHIWTPQTGLCCSAQNCWHPCVLSPVRNDPAMCPASPSSPPLAIPDLKVAVGSPAPQDCQTWQPTLVAGAEHQSPSKGVGSYRFGASTMETILYLQGIMNIFSFRVGPWKKVPQRAGSLCGSTWQTPLGADRPLLSLQESIWFFPRTISRGQLQSNNCFQGKF